MCITFFSLIEVLLSKKKKEDYVIHLFVILTMVRSNSHKYSRMDRKDRKRKRKRMKKEPRRTSHVHQVVLTEKKRNWSLAIFLNFSLYTRTVGGEIQQHYIPSLLSDFDRHCCLTSLYLPVSTWELTRCCYISLWICFIQISPNFYLSFLWSTCWIQERRAYACCFWAWP